MATIADSTLAKITEGRLVMRIYRIQPDVNTYQSFLAEDEQAWTSGQLFLDCTKKLSQWQPPDVFILQPKLKKGHFFGLGPGGFVVDSVAAEKLRDLFEMSGELLPLSHRGESYYLVNVTGCFNLLEEDETEWEINKKGVKFRIIKYAFRKNRMTENPLFKISETCRGEVLTAAGIDEACDFKRHVELEGLTGLLFEEIWEG